VKDGSSFETLVWRRTRSLISSYAASGDMTTEKLKHWKPSLKGVFLSEGETPGGASTRNRGETAEGVKQERYTLLYGKKRVRNQKPASRGPRSRWREQPHPSGFRRIRVASRGAGAQRMGYEVRPVRVGSRKLLDGHFVEILREG